MRESNYKDKGEVREKKRRGDKINEHGVVSNSIDSKIL